LISVEQAVQSAVSFFKVLQKNGGSSDLRVEEVELSQDGKSWLITLGFTTFGASFADGPRREYKLFQVNADNGHVDSMKIRVVQ